MTEKLLTGTLSLNTNKQNKSFECYLDVCDMHMVCTYEKLKAMIVQDKRYSEEKER